MTTKEFVNTVQDYYGIKYKPGAFPFIVDYLEKQPFDLEVILKETFLIFTGEYKMLPNIATFNKIVIAKNQYAKDYMVNAPGERLKFGYKQDKLQIVDKG